MASVVSDGGIIRKRPFASAAASSKSLRTDNTLHNGKPPSAVVGGAKGGDPSISGSGNADLKGLSPEDHDALQQAAADGDQDAIDLLAKIGIPLLGAAAVGGALYGASKLRRGPQAPGSDTLPDGSPKFVDGSTIKGQPGQYYRGEMTNIVPVGQPGPYQKPPPKQIANENKKLLPAPPKQIQDQRSTRFNQKGPPQQKLLPDSNRKQRETDAAYEQKAAQDAKKASKAGMEKELGQAYKIKKSQQAAKALRRVVR